MDPLANAYLKIVNESVAELQNTGVAKTDLTINSTFGHKENEKNVHNFFKNSGPEESEGAEDVEAPKEADARLSAGKENDGTPKKLDNCSKNPFDSLYNKIISEEGIMDFSTDTENPENSSFEPSEGEDYSEFGEDEEGSEQSEEGEEDEVTFTLDRETAEKLHSVLGAILGGEENESEESEEEEGAEHEEGGSEFGEEEDDEESSQNGALPFGEATDLTELSPEKGRTLIKKGSYTVKGAVPVTKKKAQTPATGKGFDGKLKAHPTSGAVSKLQSKKQDVGGVKTGKFLFDNE
jgi:hypothetical protein